MNTLHHICELNRNYLLTLLAISAQYPQLAGYILTGARCSFLYVEGFTVCLYDCPQFHSPLYGADKGSDCIPIYNQVTVMYIDPLTRQTFFYATPTTFENTPQSVIALDRDNDEQQVLKPKPVIRALWTKTSSICHKQKHFHCTKRWNLFQCWTNKLLESSSNHEKLWYYTEVFRKNHLVPFLSTSEQHPTNFFSLPNRNHFNPYKVLRVGLHDQFLNIVPLFPPDWFADAFIALLDFPCNILTQCENTFFDFL